MGDIYKVSIGGKVTYLTADELESVDRTKVTKVKRLSKRQRRRLFEHLKLFV